MALIRSGDTDHIFERFDVFESRTATGGEVFSILTCLVTITFVLLNIFPPLEMIRLKSGRQYCPGIRNVHFRLPSAAQKRRVLKLPNLAYMERWTVVRSYGDQTKCSGRDGLPYFLNHGAPQ